MKKSIFITLMLMTIPALLFAGTLFEDRKKTSDPYVSDRGGFNSIFVNPAGMAGQSGFELAVSVGGNTTTNDVKLLMGVTDMAMEFAGGGIEVETVADTSQTLSELYTSGVITDDLLDAVFEGTNLDPDTFTDWDDPVLVQAAIEDVAFDPVTVENNFNEIMNNPASAQYADFYAGLPGEVSVDAAASLKTGFLIKGFGLGVYDNAVAVAFMDPASQEYGMETIHNELGVISGFGFNLFEGKLALGVSGNYGILMKNTSPVGFDSFDQLFSGTGTIRYGYTWGVDIGAIWRPAPSLGVGVVCNDVVGYTEADMPYTADGIAGFMTQEAFWIDSLNYQFTMDMDMGISWQPDWRFVRPRMGLDLYNVIGYGRDVAENGDTFSQAMYRTLEHIRVGAEFTFFDFLKVGGQYYDHYLSVGAGLDLLFLELYGEFKVSDEAFMADTIGDVPIGADLTVRIHF